MNTATTTDFNLDDLDMDDFFSEQTEKTIQNIRELYKRDVNIDWNGLFGTAKITVDGMYAMSAPKDARIINYIIDTIRSVLAIERTHLLDELQKQVEHFYD